MGMQPEYYIDLENRFSAHNYQPLDIVVERAEGVWVYDIAGRRYLDCLSSYSALNHGHRHPRLVEAMNAIGPSHSHISRLSQRSVRSFLSRSERTYRIRNDLTNEL